MKIRLLVIFLGILCSIWLPAQQQSGKNSYKRMESSFDGKAEVMVNFIRLFDNVRGNYQFKYKENDQTTYYGKMIEVEGRITAGDSVLLKEFGAENYSFQGLWEGNEMTGSWRVPENNDYMEVLLKEYYPNGSIPFDVYYLQSEQKLINNQKDSPAATLELTLLYPKNEYFKAQVLDSVMQTIVKSFFGNGFQMKPPEKMIHRFEDEYYKLYTEGKEDYFKLGGASFNWATVNEMSVLFNSDYLLCIEYQKYAYTGGAHGMTNVSYDIINLKNGSKLSGGDIFVEGSDLLITTLLTNKMIEKYRSKKEESTLKKIGFWVDSIKPNQNIYLTGNGIGFKYASYELAPYALGLPEVFLTFDEIREIIKPGTPVYRLSRRKFD